MSTRSMAGLVVLLGLAGCAVAHEVEPGLDESGQSDEAIKSRVCPAAPSVCLHGGRCGSTVCKAGQVCEPGAKCPRFDPSDPHPCDPIPPSCVDAPKKGACKSDADCRLFDDYCTGCDCRALSSSEKNPTCSGPGVRCLREPCGGLSAHCDAGKCVAR